MGYIYLYWRGNYNITKIFKHTDIKMAYHTNTTIPENLTPKTLNHEKFSPTGITN